jgi:tetratricopeptide (TPR) repeat protein
MFGENLAALFLLYARPVAAIGRILDRGRLWIAIVMALAVSWLVHFAETRTEIVSQPPAGVAAPNAPVPLVDEDEATVLPPRPSVTESAIRIWTALDPLSLFAGLGAIVFAFVPAVIGARAAAGFGSFGVLMRRDYLSLVMISMTVWTAAYLPAGVILFLVPPQLPLWPLLIASNLYFLVLAALSIRTLLGINFAPAAGLAVLGAVTAMIALALYQFAGPLRYMVMSPFFLLYGLYFGYSMFVSNVRSLGDGLRSRQHFQQQLEIATNNPRDADAHYQLGLIHLQRRQRTEAAARFRRAVEIDPSEADAQYQLGRIAREEKRLDDAIASLTTAASLDDKLSQSEVWRELGAAYFEAARTGEAAAALVKFTDRRPYDPEGLYWHGKTLVALGRTTEAREMFEQAIEAVKTMPSHRRAEVRQWGGQSKSELRKL